MEGVIISGIGDYLCYRKKFLVLNFVSRNLKTKYRRSVLGMFWTQLVPLALSGIYFFVFHEVLKIRVPNYLLFIVSGVLPWTFFSQTISEGMESLVGNWPILSKVPVPLQVFPYVGTITNFTTLLLSIPVLLLIGYLSGVPVFAGLPLLLVYYVILFFMTYAFSVILAVAYVYLRDLKHILGIVLQLWFYATPIIYERGMIPASKQWILPLNPVSFVFTGIRDALIWTGKVHWYELGISLLWASILVVTSMIILRLSRRNLVEQL